MNSFFAASLGPSARIQISPDQSMIAMTYPGVRVHRFPTLELAWESKRSDGRFYVAISPNSELVAVKSTLGRVQLYRANNGKQIADFKNESDGEGANQLFSPEGDAVIDGSWKGHHIVRALDGREIFREPFNHVMVTHVLSGKGGFYWFVNQDKFDKSNPDAPCEQWMIGRQWPFENGKYERIAVPVVDISAACFNSDYSEVAIVHGFGECTVAIYSFPQMSLRLSIPLPPEMIVVEKVCYSPNSRCVAVTGTDLALFFSSGDGRELARVTLPQCRDVCFSRDSKWIAVASDIDGTLRKYSELLKQ